MGAKRIRSLEFNDNDRIDDGAKLEWIRSGFLNAGSAATGHVQRIKMSSRSTGAQQFCYTLDSTNP